MNGNKVPMDEEQIRVGFRKLLELITGLQKELNSFLLNVTRKTIGTYSRERREKERRTQLGKSLPPPAQPKTKGANESPEKPVAKKGVTARV